MNARTATADDKPATPARAMATAIHAAIETAHALGVPHDYARAHALKRIREPKHLAFIGHDTQSRPQWLAPHAARAWMRMRDAAVRESVELQIISAFRGVEHQLGIVRRKLEHGLSMHEILRVSAAPGYSEHHSGRALDITAPGFAALEEEFENSSAFAWLSANAQHYGFHLSYPRHNPHGIAYEPWHWCWQSARRAR